ncbi:hypothetical protein ABT034_30150 [Streptomyces sp. NPDC002773]
MTFSLLVLVPLLLAVALLPRERPERPRHRRGRRLEAGVTWRRAEG